MNNNRTNNNIERFVLPNAVEIENELIGAMLLSGIAVLDSCMDIWGDTNPLYNESNKAIYDAIKYVYKLGLNPDLMLVANRLKDVNSLELVGGYVGLVKLTETYLVAHKIEDYANVILSKYMARQILDISANVIQKVKEGIDPLSLIDETEDDLSKISNLLSGNDYEHISQSGIELLRDIEEYENNPDVKKGIPSGLTELDRVIGGWREPDMIIIAARPSVGKSAFAFNMALNAAQQGYPAGIFSLEMSNAQVVERILSNIADIPLSKIRDKNLDKNEKERLIIGVDELNHLPIYIDDTAGLNIFQFRSKVRSMKNKHDINMVVVDYIQLMSGIDKSNRIQNREQEIAHISREIKKLAKELNIAIIALSQLSRGIEHRSDPEPKLSDIRESGAIEQDADIVAFLARPDYQKGNEEVPPELQNMAMLFIKKHRNGALANVKIKTNLEVQRFEDFEGTYHQFGSNNEIITHNETAPF